MLLFNLNRRVYQVLALLWTAVILYLTLNNNPPNPSWMDDIPHFDKIAHFGIFCIWSGLALLCFQKWNKWLNLILVNGSGTLFAILTEWGQSWLPNRQSDYLDLLADVFGLAIGIIFTMTMKKRE